jgi:hypothetical protein
MYYLLQDIGFDVELLIVVKTDIIGAPCMSQNASKDVRTLHIDTRYHFTRENVKDGIIKIKFVKLVHLVWLKGN